MSTKSQTINITVPKELLRMVDVLARQEYTSRSDVIRQSLLDRIRKTNTDEWNDAKNWETVVDFTSIMGGGMPAKEFMSRLKALDGQN